MFPIGGVTIGGFWDEDFPALVPFIGGNSFQRPRLRKVPKADDDEEALLLLWWMIQ
jgi:hypothetical protein